MGSLPGSSSRSFPQWLDPTRGGIPSAFAVLSTGTFAFFSARAALTTGVFTSDDLGFSWQARTQPLRRLLLLPMDVHVVPLHRFVSFALASMAPMNAGVALAAMLAMHAASLLLLHAALQALSPCRSHALVTAWYGTFLHLAPLLAWWTAALHRLPYLVCLGVAALEFAKFRKSASYASGAWVVGSTAIACGFFEKGLLIPLILAGLETSLAAHDRKMPSKRAVLLLAMTGGVAAVWFFLRQHIAAAAFRGMSGDFRFLAEYLRLSWAMLLCGVVGIQWGSLVPGALLLGLLALSTTWLARSNAILWVSAALTVSFVLVVTGLPLARVQLYGFVPVISSIYYPDAMFVLCLFAGVAVSRALVSPHAQRLSIAARALTGWACVLLTASISVRATVNGTHLVSDNRELPGLTRFYGKIRSGVRDLQKHGVPLRFVDGRVPLVIQPYPNESSTHHATLIGLGFEPQMVKQPGPGVYRIADDGRVVPSRL